MLFIMMTTMNKTSMCFDDDDDDDNPVNVDVEMKELDKRWC